MAIKFIGDIDEKKFRSGMVSLYRFVTIQKLKQAIENKNIRFSHPERDWKDPYERYYLQAQFTTSSGKQNLPARDRIFGLCFSLRYNSEAYWKVYSPNIDGVRLEINSSDIVEELIKIKNVNIFIGKVDYLPTYRFSQIPKELIGLRNEIEKNIIDENQILLMLKKRMSFIYEKEIRIFAVTPNEQKEYLLNLDIGRIVNKFDLDPRMNNDDYAFYSNELTKYYSINSKKIGKSKLFDEPKKHIFKTI